MKALVTTIFLALTHLAIAQAPSGAPPNASGICKDGTYSTAAVKDGACRGHKGVQTWYKAAVPSLPAPGPGTAATVPAPTPATARRSKPVPVPATSPSLPPPAPTASSPSRPAPTPAAAAPSQPTPSPMSAPPAMPAPKPSIADQHARLTSAPAAPGGGPGLVWVNTASKVYHCQGSDYYGKTKAGSYMSESAAKTEGDRPNRNKPCS